MEQGRELDRVRELIVKKSREKGVTLAELSRLAERNEAYVHQFIYRGSPKHLPEDVRKVISISLEIPEDDLLLFPVIPKALRGRQPSVRHADVDAPAQQSASSAVAVLAAPGLPVFNDGDTLDMDSPREHTPCPPYLVNIPGAFAVWVAAATGRLRPGDLAYVRPNQPPRLGDTAVVVQDSRLAMIGELDRMDGGTVSLKQDDDQAREFKREDVRLMKVVGTYIG
ncbi:hypothetical protein [Azospirillum sp.]|uniref:hypothetical protein n=1 Tax=Azospirillum sp. TaxID=34012 RepID=UPI003D735A8D